MIASEPDWELLRRAPMRGCRGAVIALVVVVAVVSLGVLAPRVLSIHTSERHIESSRVELLALRTVQLPVPAPRSDAALFSSARTAGDLLVADWSARLTELEACVVPSVTLLRIQVDAERGEHVVQLQTGRGDNLPRYLECLNGDHSGGKWRVVEFRETQAATAGADNLVLDSVMARLVWHPKSRN